MLLCGVALCVVVGLVYPTYRADCKNAAQIVEWRFEWLISQLNI